MSAQTLFHDRYGLRLWVQMTIAIACLAVVIASVVAGAFAADRHSCRRVADAMQREYRWGWAEGCMLRLDDGTYVDRSDFHVNRDDVR